MDLDKQNTIRDNHLLHIQKYLDSFQAAIGIDSTSGVEDDYLVELTELIEAETKTIKDLIKA